MDKTQHVFLALVENFSVQSRPIVTHSTWTHFAFHVITSRGNRLFLTLNLIILDIFLELVYPFKKS